MPDSRRSVDSHRLSLELGPEGDVVLTTDSAGHLKINGVAGSGYASLASATALPTPTARVCEVTGTATITSIVGNGSAGQVATLIFRSTATLTDGGNLKLASTLVATADDVIELVSDGTAWYEQGRSVN